MRGVALWAVMALTACGNAPKGGGVQVNVTYRLSGGSAGCVRVRAVPDVGKDDASEIGLEGRPRMGGVRVGVNRRDEWPEPGVTLISTLHAASCADPAVVTRTLTARFPSGTVDELDVTLEEPVSDGGQAGGAGGGGGGGDAGGGGGAAGGSGGGAAGGSGGGAAGGSGGGAAGGSGGGAAGGSGGGAAGGMAGGGGGGAAGGAAGGTAGGSGGGTAGGSGGGSPIRCDGGFVIVAAPATMDVNDVSVLAGGVWIGGTNSPRLAFRDAVSGDGGFVGPSGTCSENADALWAAPGGPVFFAGNFGRIDRLASTSAACTAGPVVQNSRVTSMIGFPVGGGYEVIVGHEDGRISHRGLDGLMLTLTQDMGDDVWAIDGFSPNTLYASGGAGGGGRGAIFKRQPDAGWTTDLALTTGNTRLFALSVASPALAYAAGETPSVYRLSDGGWVPDMATPFTIRSLEAFSETAIYAVGDSATVQKWNGNQWQQVASFAGVTSLKEIRGDSECNLWVVGPGGFVATTNQP